MRLFTVLNLGIVHRVLQCFKEKHICQHERLQQTFSIIHPFLFTHNLLLAWARVQFVPTIIIPCIAWSLIIWKRLSHYNNIISRNHNSPLATASWYESSFFSGASLIMSSILRMVMAASVANLRLLTLLTAGSSTPACLLSLTAPLWRSRPTLCVCVWVCVCVRVCVRVCVCVGVCV